MSVCRSEPQAKAFLNLEQHGSCPGDNVIIYGLFPMIHGTRFSHEQTVRITGKQIAIGKPILGYPNSKPLDIKTL
jgi:hypothetical protein